MTEPAPKLVSEQHLQRRQSAREAVDMATIVLRAGRNPLDVRLVDISPFGFHARFTGAPFQRGETVHIDLPIVGLVRAQVMWGLKGCFGNKFTVPIDAATFLRMCAAIRSSGEEWRGQP